MKGFDAVKRKITLIQILFLCVFIGCGIYFVKFKYDKSQTEKEIEQLQSMVKDTDKEVEQPDRVEFEIGDSDDATETPENEYESNGMLTRYYDLYKLNEDMVGWIKIDGTVIDYPVVYNETNNVYYLHRNFYKYQDMMSLIA